MSLSHCIGLQFNELNQPSKTCVLFRLTNNHLYLFICDRKIVCVQTKSTIYSYLASQLKLSKTQLAQMVSNVCGSYMYTHGSRSWTRSLTSEKAFNEPIDIWELL